MQMAITIGSGGGLPRRSQTRYSNNSLESGTVSAEVKAAAARTRTRRQSPAPPVDQRAKHTDFAPQPPYISPLITETTPLVQLTGAPSVQQGPDYIQGDTQVPLVQFTGAPGIQQGIDYLNEFGRPISVAEMRQLYPGISEATFRSAVATGLQFRTDPQLDVGGVYLAYENLIKILPGAPFGSMAHEFVHYAHARASNLLDPTSLTPEQMAVHRSALRYMAARSSPLGTGTPIRSATANLRTILAGDIFSPYNNVVPGNEATEQIAFSLAGGQTLEQQFPSQYFSELFEGGAKAAGVLQARGIQRPGYRGYR